jgi:hypothetical protein
MVRQQRQTQVWGLAAGVASKLSNCSSNSCGLRAAACGCPVQPGNAARHQVPSVGNEGMSSCCSMSCAVHWPGLCVLLTLPAPKYPAAHTAAAAARQRQQSAGVNGSMLPKAGVLSRMREKHALAASRACTGVQSRRMAARTAFKHLPACLSNAALPSARCGVTHLPSSSCAKLCHARCKALCMVDPAMQTCATAACAPVISVTGTGACGTAAPDCATAAVLASGAPAADASASPACSSPIR